MSTLKEMKSRIAPESGVLEELKTAAKRGDWKLALFRYETLRFGYGWRYARFAAEFGEREWEAIAVELEDQQNQEDQ